jgi:hypothetical protein
MESNHETKLRRVIQEMLEEYLPHINAIVEKYEHNINQLAIFLFYRSKTNQLTAILYYIRSLLDYSELTTEENELIASVEPELESLRLLKSTITTKEGINFFVSTQFFEKIEDKCFMRIIRVIQQKHDDIKILKQVLIASNILDTLLGLVHMVAAFEKDDLFAIDESERENDKNWQELKPFYKSITTGKKEDILEQYETGNKSIYIFKAAYLKSTKSLINIKNHKILEELISNKLMNPKDDGGNQNKLKSTSSFVSREIIDAIANPESSHINEIETNQANQQPTISPENQANETTPYLETEGIETNKNFADKTTVDQLQKNSKNKKTDIIANSNKAIQDSKIAQKTSGSQSIGNIPSKFWQNTFNYMYSSEVR